MNREVFKAYIRGQMGGRYGGGDTWIAIEAMNMYDEVGFDEAKEYFDYYNRKSIRTVWYAATGIIICVGFLAALVL